MIVTNGFVWFLGLNDKKFQKVLFCDCGIEINRMSHKQSVRASALQITNQNCQLKVRALLSLEKMSIFYSNKWHIFTCVQSTVQCREMRCANESKNNTVYSTAAGGGGCSAVAAHQSRAKYICTAPSLHISSRCTLQTYWGMNAMCLVSRAAADHISCLQMMISCSSLWTWMTISVTRFCPTTETRSSWSVSGHQ